MGMLLFWTALIVVFVLVPLLVTRMVCGMAGIRDRSLQIGVFCLTAWAWWQHWQLPPEQTGRGYSAARPLAPDADPVRPATAAH